MQYEVEVVADELMLTAEELKEIFECYFVDAVELIASCYIANRERDYIMMAKHIHALKGSSMNLRMHDLVIMTIELGSLAQKKQEVEIIEYLPKFEQAVAKLKEEIQTFYHQPTARY